MALFQVTVVLVVCAALVIVSNVDGLDVSLGKLACNGKTFIILSDYAQAKDLSLDDVIKKTPISKYDYYGDGIYNSTMAYSHGKCKGSLSTDECGRCLQVAKRQIIASCTWNAEGWVQLTDYFIGYWEFPMN